MAQQPEAGSLAHVRWSDPQFFSMFPLNTYTVLDYFSRSPFYDPQCNNEECKRQGLPLEHLRNMPPGTEYVLTRAEEHDWGALYVIKMQHRTGPESAQPRAFYYVLSGEIFQAPSLLACLQVRAERCRYRVNQAFERLKSDLEPLGWRQRHQERKLKHAKKNVNPDSKQDLEMATPTSNAQNDPEDSENIKSEEYEADKESAFWMAQQPPVPPEMPKWISDADQVIMNVLSRHELPSYEQENQLAHNGDNQTETKDEPTAEGEDKQL